MDMIDWLQKWYLSRCDEDWEHEYGVHIDTLDNPGWSVIIDLSNTEIEDLEIQYTLTEKSDVDWIGYSILNKTFKGVGGPQKLNSIISLFKEIWETNCKKIYH